MGKKIKRLTKKELKQVEDLSGMHTKEYVAYALGITKDVYFDIEARQPELIEAYDRGRYKLDEFAFNRMRENIKRGCTQSIHLYLKTKGGWNVKKTSPEKDNEADCEWIIIDD